MAAATFAVSDPDTGIGSNYDINTFTPAAGDLIVVFASWAGVDPTLVTLSAVDDQGGTYAVAAEISRQANQHTFGVFVREQAAVASPTVVTITTTGDSATGNNTHVYRVANPGAFGSAAVVQTALLPDQVTGTPGFTFGAPVDTNNPTIGAVASTAASPLAAAPVGWTSGADDTHASPVNSVQSVFRNSGFSGTGVTWSASIGSDWAGAMVEIAAESAEEEPASALHPWIKIA